MLMVYAGVSGSGVLDVSRVQMIYVGVSGAISFRRLRVLYKFHRPINLSSQAFLPVKIIYPNFPPESQVRLWRRKRLGRAKGGVVVVLGLAMGLGGCSGAVMMGSDE